MPEIIADQNVECVICMDTNNEPFSLLSCGHGGPGHDPMHKICLRQHFQAQVNDNRVEGIAYVTCPICRQHPSMLDIESIMQ
jgi:hypothetical protein